MIKRALYGLIWCGIMEIKNYAELIFCIATLIILPEPCHKNLIWLLLFVISISNFIDVLCFEYYLKKYRNHQITKDEAACKIMSGMFFFAIAPDDIQKETVKRIRQMITKMELKDQEKS